MPRPALLVSLLGLALLALPELAVAQTPENSDRRETTREREDPERAQEPPDRNNPGRIDPLLEAELEKCEGLEPQDHERCIVSARRRFGEM